MLSKVTVETTLNAELDEHLGYEKHVPARTDNSRNGYSSKRLITDDGEIQLDVPRDRDASFEPKLVAYSQGAEGIAEVIIEHESGLTKNC